MSNPGAACDGMFRPRMARRPSGGIPDRWHAQRGHFRRRLEQVAENTGFEIEGLADAPVTRDPSAEALRIIREVLDPRGFRDREVPAA